MHSRKKVIGLDLLSARSKLCESTFLQESVSTSAPAPSLVLRRRNVFSVQIACQKLADDVYQGPQVQIARETRAIFACPCVF